MNKKRIIILITGICLLSVLCGGLVCARIWRTNKTVSVTLDNAYRNTMRNISAEAAGGGNALYFNADNRFFFRGIYRIDDSGARRLYRAPFSLYKQYIPFSGYYHRGELADVVDGEICRLNMETAEFVPYLHPPVKDGETLTTLFTTGGELYYTTGVAAGGRKAADDRFTEPPGLASTDTIYHYVDEETVDIAASDALCGEGYDPWDYCGGRMYYFSEGLDAETPVPNDFQADLRAIGQRRLYEYDLTTRKTTRCFDFSCLDSAIPDRNCALEDVFVADDQVYLFVSKLESLADHYPQEFIRNDAMLQDIGHAEATLIFRYDSRTDALEKLMEIDDCSLTVNGCGGNVYMKVVTEHYQGSTDTTEDGLYAFRADSAEPTRLHTGRSVRSLYVFDEEWLYYSTDDSRLCRIRPDDTGNEQVL